MKASAAAKVRGGALTGQPLAVSYKPTVVSYKDPGTVFIKEAYKIN